jgi:hypothetical protein
VNVLFNKGDARDTTKANGTQDNMMIAAAAALGPLAQHYAAAACALIKDMPFRTSSLLCGTVNRCDREAIVSEW